MRRTKAEAEETRSRILHAAEKAFYDKGVANTTLEDIATAAGVTRGAIYWHFSNKNDLFLELYNSVSLPIEDMIRKQSDYGGHDVLHYIQTSTTEWLDELATDEHRQRILSILMRGPYNEDMMPVLEKQQEVDDRHMLMLEKAFGRAKSDGFLNDIWTPLTATKALRWTMGGLCNDWLLFGRRFDIAQEGRDALKGLFDSFRQTGRQTA
jgi:AcrR family transcriptional regulator